VLHGHQLPGKPKEKTLVYLFTDFIRYLGQLEDYVRDLSIPKGLVPKNQKAEFLHYRAESYWILALRFAGDAGVSFRGVGILDQFRQVSEYVLREQVDMLVRRLDEEGQAACKAENSLYIELKHFLINHGVNKENEPDIRKSIHSKKILSDVPKQSKARRGQSIRRGQSFKYLHSGLVDRLDDIREFAPEIK
jgi:hypothetical protein